MASEAKFTERTRSHVSKYVGKVSGSEDFDGLPFYSPPAIRMAFELPTAYGAPMSRISLLSSAIFFVAASDCVRRTRPQAA
jgi:hypothetical protein